MPRLPGTRVHCLRHQVSVLRRQQPGPLRLFSTDRLLWVWLYLIWPQVLNAMVLVKPATVVRWHRKGFRRYWRCRSRRPGRPKMSTEIRDLIPPNEPRQSALDAMGRAATIFADPTDGEPHGTRSRVWPLRSKPGATASGSRAGCGVRGIEAYIIHPTSVAVSREHRRAKTDRLSALRGSSGRRMSWRAICDGPTTAARNG